MKLDTVRTGMYTVHTSHHVASIMYAGYAVHNTEYSVCLTKYTVRPTAYTSHIVLAL